MSATFVPCLACGALAALDGLFCAACGSDQTVPDESLDAIRDGRYTEGMTNTTPIPRDPEAERLAYLQDLLGPVEGAEEYDREILSRGWDTGS